MREENIRIVHYRYQDKEGYRLSKGGPLKTIEGDLFGDFKISDNTKVKSNNHPPPQASLLRLKNWSATFQNMTVLPGGVIATGTPEGVGPTVAGDVVGVKIEGIGILRKYVGDEVLDTETITESGRSLDYLRGQENPVL